MAKIVFEQIIDFITAATPSTGYLIGYDLDGVLKQKDRFGVITPIGASAVSIPPSNPLDIVLLNGNDSGSSDIIMGTSTSIVSSRGSGRLELDNSSDVVLLSTDNSDILLNIGSVSISNVNGLTSSSIIVSETTEINVSNSTYSSKIEQSINDFNISFTNDSLPGIKDSKVIESGENWIAGNDNRTYLHLNTKDSVTNPNIRNSVIIGGVGLTASSNETAYFKNSQTQGGLSKYSIDPSSLVGYDNLTMITKGILDTGTSSIYNYIDTEILPFIGNGLYESGTGTDSIESVHSGNASGDYSVVSGGLNNISSGVGSFIGSGFSNTSSGYQSSIVGGLNNSIDNTSGYSSIVSGYANIISGTSSYSSIGGGVLNTISESSIVSFIGGGDNNRISETSNNSTIGGGTGNIISNNSSRSTISGGQSNTISTGSDTSTIGGGYGNNISGTSSYVLIGGGSYNAISGTSSYSTISAGYYNTITNDSSYSSISGGYCNTVSNSSMVSTIVGGGTNTISTYSGYSSISGQSNTITTLSYNSSIGGGSANTILNNSHYSTIGGGQSNTINNSGSSFISGGLSNTLDSSSNSSIVGGNTNVILNTSEYSFIGSGYANIISETSSYSFIGGGRCNTISGTSSCSTISGGYCNTVSTNSGYSSIGGLSNKVLDNSSYSTISGGHYNTISINSSNSSVSGGYSNKVSDNSSFSTISGGYRNTVSDNSCYSTISGGCSNTINSGMYSNISSGTFNKILNNTNFGFIGTGPSNTISSTNFGFIGSGQSNTVNSTNFGILGSGFNNNISSSDFGFIGSGHSNTINSNSCFSSITSGLSNKVLDNSSLSTISGGHCNTVSDNSSLSTISGGCSNTVSDNSCYSTISGGRSNIVSTNSYCSTISGGYRNTVSTNSSLSTISGGCSNTISTNSCFSSIVGGFSNTISGTSSYSSILGGCNSSINSDNIFVLGSNITANTSNFTYVNNLNIVDTPTTNNSNNNVVVRNSSTGELEINDSLLSLITTGVRFQGDYNATTNTPDLDTTPISGIVKGDMYVVSVSNSDQFFTVEVEVGDMLISKVDSPTLESDWTVVQANLTPSSIKIQYESNSNTNAYTDSEKTKVGHITVTQAVDLDTMESDIATNNLKVSNVTTNLSVGNKTSTTLDVLSSDGTDATIPSATITEAGLLSASDKVKLDGSTSGNGTINYLTKWTTTGTTLGNSIIRDDGSTIGINTSPSSVTKIDILSDKEEGFAVSQTYTSTTGNSTGMRVSTYGNNTSIPNFGIKTSAKLGLGNVGIGSNTSGVGQGYVSGADIAVMGTAGRTNGDNYGGYFSSGVVNTGVNYGIKSIASNSTSANYSIWLLDGSEGLGKFLKSVTSDGKANWSNISFSDVSSSGITEKTSIDNQDILVIEDSDDSFVKKTVKRINLIRPVNNTQTSTNSLTPDSDENQQETITALAANLAINAPSGSSTNGQTLIIRIKDDGTARTLTWNAIYRAIGVTIPTTTTISKTLYLGFIYNSTDTKWDCVAVNEEA